MEAEERAEGTATQYPERRRGCRYAVDEASVVLLVSHGLPMECRILDLSLEGCRMRTGDRFHGGIGVRVEVAFKVNGIAFRFSGVIRWTDGRHLAGIHFVDVAMRRREALVEVLDEVEAANAAKAAREAADRLAAEQQAEAQAQQAREAVERQASEQAGIPGAVEPAKPASRERRAQSRHGVDTSAVIYLIKIGSRLSGRILDLSVSGCRICTDERFPVGIYTRVETEFRLEGLPFRLGGVIQAVHDRDRHMVGIRFLDMSERKRDQVEQLIGEIEELRARKELAQAKPLGE
ncbi:MAG: PilZ domain-containing protein [Terracidiphilus sp.]|nr:PilZ domain-containing protein [Terracidiphilus sp.]